MTQQLLRVKWVAFFILCLLFGGVFSIHLGQDTNWDLLNYHLHNVWALLHNKTAANIFAADIQTYYSPLADLPYYLLAIHFFPDAPRLVAFIMGLPFGLLVFIVFSIAWLFTKLSMFL